MAFEEDGALWRNNDGRRCAAAARLLVRDFYFKRLITGVRDLDPLAWRVTIIECRDPLIGWEVRGRKAEQKMRQHTEGVSLDCLAHQMPMRCGRRREVTWLRQSRLSRATAERFIHGVRSCSRALATPQGRS